MSADGARRAAAAHAADGEARVEHLGWSLDESPSHSALAVTDIGLSHGEGAGAGRSAVVLAEFLEPVRQRQLAHSAAVRGAEGVGDAAGRRAMASLASATVAAGEPARARAPSD